MYDQVYCYRSNYAKSYRHCNGYHKSFGGRRLIPAKRVWFLTQTFQGYLYKLIIEE
jgi:hypothetical protein